MSRKGRKARSSKFACMRKAKAYRIASPQIDVRDSYLSQISDTSLEILEHFGAEAPALLNQYCCAVEDKLIDALKEIKRLQQIVDRNGYDKGRVATAPI